MWSLISANVSQVMEAMPQITTLGVVPVELVPSKAAQETLSVPLVHLDHLFLVVAPRPQTQILVFVEPMLR